MDAREEKGYRRFKAHEYRARSAEKLVEILDTYGILGEKDSVIDLGAAPGSWTQVVRENTDGIVVAVDIKPIVPIENVWIIQGNIASAEVLEQIRHIADVFDLVLCDGAPDVTGIHEIDEYRQYKFVMHAFEVAKSLLKENGTFVFKYFIGRNTDIVPAQFSKYFETIELFKPVSSRMTSTEVFCICRKYH